MLEDQGPRDPVQLRQAMRPETELAGLATSALVLGASRLGLPVSTTHVSVGSILGIGAEGASLRARAARPRRCVADHRETYGVEPICSVLPIAPSTYYEQKVMSENCWK